MSFEYEALKEHIKKLGFDIDIEAYEKLKRFVEVTSKDGDINGLEHYMKQVQNCGGYALQIPICIFSGDDYTFEEKVLRITELYPFVRLLSDTELKQDEYAVVFRAGKTGHHFIQVDENGKATEKCESDLPRNFQGWRRLEDSPEAVFAVVKQEYRDKSMRDLPQCNRDMFLDEEAYYMIEDSGFKSILKKKADKPITFNEKLQDAYNNKSSTFTYQGKTFYLKINKNDPELIYICDDNEILGELCTDGKEFVIELNDTKKNKIFGYEPSKPLEIKYEDEDIDDNLQK